MLRDNWFRSLAMLGIEPTGSATQAPELPANVRGDHPGVVASLLAFR